MQTRKKAFDLEVERILNLLWNDSIPQVEHVVKRAVINSEYRYIQYLEELKIIKRIGNHGGGKFGIQLEKEGYRVFEEFEGWENYKRKVLKKKEKLDRSKALAIQYWWVPIAVSVMALLVSVLTLLMTL